MDCVFCKIINKEAFSDIVYENDEVLAFKDINPKAKHHFLIVPKIHIASVISEGSEKIINKLITAAKEITQEQGIKGFRLVFNVGKEGGQIIEHLHLHFLVGEDIQIP